MSDQIQIGPLLFEHEGNEMFVHRLADPANPGGDGDHIATAEGVWPEVWEAFVAAAPPPPQERDPACVERWPECEIGAYDPRCCRFPKSCSCWAPPPQETP